MKTKKTVLAISVAAMLGCAFPALADAVRRVPDHGYRSQPANTFFAERRHFPVAREVVAPRSFTRSRVVVQPVYAQPQPRVVYETPAYYAPPAYEPAPVAYRHEGNAAGVIGGAIIGAAIGSQFGEGDDRAAATAIGAFLGGIIGSGF